MNDTEIHESLKRILAEHALPLDVPADPALAADAAHHAAMFLRHVTRRINALVIPDTDRVRELHHADGEPAGVYACRVCLTAYTDPRYATCCGPVACDCGGVREKGRSWCDTCWNRQRAETAKTTWGKATPTPAATYGDGMVYVEDDSGRDWGGNEGWHQCLDDLRHTLTDWRAEHPGEPDPVLLVYGAEPRKMTLDVDHIIENALDEFHEGAEDQISREALAELETFLDAWTEKHGPTTYDPDMGVKIDDWQVTP